jgi:NadR type nicotinamide-nucleotide adenylyltransferase
MKKYHNCLIIGKFMPPHKGHEYMIRFAKEFSEQVHVVVDCVKGQPIDPAIRKQWLEEEIPNIQAYALDKFMPQDPSETSDFWSIWKTTLLDTLAANGVVPDVVVAAMDYGYELAEVMGCDFIPIDIARETFPVSATMLRENVFESWDFLIDSARPYFIKKLCLLGPESTGKSTLGKALAKELNTIYVPEYAKAVIEKQEGEFHPCNVEKFVEAQINTEKALAKFTNKIMICDSSAITTQIYAKLCFEEEFAWIDDVIKNHKYDHYLLLSPDVPFVDDIHRQNFENPKKMRKEVFELFKERLEYFNLPYTVIGGTYANRNHEALIIAKQLIV